MSRISRRLQVGALIFIFFITGCGVITRPGPTPVWTVSPGRSPVLPTDTLPPPVTETATSPTPAIPITGENVVSLQCQFCVGDQTHAMLAFPSFASFDVNASSPVTCLTADVVDGQRIVICRGTQSTTFNLKVCGDADNCLEFPVALQPCPLLQAGTTTPLVTSTPFAPVFLTPIPPIKKTREPASTSTPVAVPATPTSPPATSYP